MIFAIIMTNPLPVKDGSSSTTFTYRSPRRTTTVEPYLVLCFFILQRFSQALGYRFRQFYLVDAVACSLKQPDLVLTQGQNIEASIVSQERQQWLEIEMVTHNHLLFKTTW